MERPFQAVARAQKDQGIAPGVPTNHGLLRPHWQPRTLAGREHRQIDRVVSHQDRAWSHHKSPRQGRYSAPIYASTRSKSGKTTSLPWNACSIEPTSLVPTASGMRSHGSQLLRYGQQSGLAACASNLLLKRKSISVGASAYSSFSTTSVSKATLAHQIRAPQ